VVARPGRKRQESRGWGGVRRGRKGPCGVGYGHVCVPVCAGSMGLDFRVWGRCVVVHEDSKLVVSMYW